MENATEVKRIEIKMDPEGTTHFAFRMLDTAVGRLVHKGTLQELINAGDLLIGLNIALSCATDGEATDQERLNVIAEKVNTMMVALTDKRDSLQRQQDEIEEDDEAV
jgi:hypothetical protein